MDTQQSRKPQRLRGLTPLLRDAAPLVMLASGLFYTNRFLTLTSDEVSAIGDSARSAAAIFAGFRSPEAVPVSALYSFLLHFWLRITGGAFDALRAPSIICFVFGLWILSRVARQFGGDESSNALVWLAALWPFGFHYGRLVGQYSLAFLLLAAATWQYFRCRDSERRSGWVLLALLFLLLLYTTSFGWALFFAVAIDYWWGDSKTDIGEASEPKSDRTRKARVILAGVAVLAIGFAPRWPAFIRMFRSVTWPHSVRFLVLDAAYNFYTLFVGPAVAPFYWRLSIPAALGVVALLALVFAAVHRDHWTLPALSLLLFVLMTLTATVQFSRLLLVAPWLLLPIAIALGTIEKWQWRIPVALAMAVVAAIGWYGALNRQYYAEATFLEPWPSVAQEAVETIRGGGGVISNDKRFFLYLTYALKPSSGNSSWRFSGALPAEVEYPSVWNPMQWENAGRPQPSRVFWVLGSSSPEEFAALQNAGQWLSSQCGDRITRFLARDPAYSWKQRFVPNFSGSAWRIEIRQYTCGETAPPSGALSPNQR